jgi:hypothetical protein
LIGRWPQRTALRGGSWNNNQNNARVADRNRNNPNNRNNNIGFRVVVLHNFACQECVQFKDWRRGKNGRPVARFNGDRSVEPNIGEPYLFQ